MFIHLNRLYIGRDIELYALVPHHYRRGGRFGFSGSNVYILVHMGPSNVNDHTFLDMYGYIILMAIFWCQKLFEGSSTLRFGEQYIAVNSHISENIYRCAFICIWNNNIITLHMIAIMAILPSGTFKIVQKECSFTRIAWIVAEI